MRIEWSDRAADLKAISEYIEKDRDLGTSNRLTRTIYDAIQSLRRLLIEAVMGDSKIHESWSL